MSNNNLQWNVETKYNLVTVYKNRTILRDVLNLANSYPGVCIPNEEILLKSFPHWELNKIKSDEGKRKKLLRDEDEQRRIKEKIISKVQENVFVNDDPKEKEKTKEELIKENEELKKSILIYEDFIKWINDNDKLSGSSVFEYIKEKEEWATTNKINKKKWALKLGTWRSSYNEWLKREVPVGKEVINGKLYRMDWLNIIQECSDEEYGLVGASYIQHMIHKRGYDLEIKTTQRYMNALGLHCPGTINFNTKPKSHKEIKFTLWGYDNLLKSYDETKKKFVMDYLEANPLTNIYTDEMFVEIPGPKSHAYISTIICGYLNYVLAIHVSDTRDSEIAHITLERAISNVGADALKNSILQTDHAMIYFSKEFGKHCKEIGIKTINGLGWCFDW